MTGEYINSKYYYHYQSITKYIQYLKHREYILPIITTKYKQTTQGKRVNQESPKNDTVQFSQHTPSWVAKKPLLNKI